MMIFRAETQYALRALLVLGHRQEPARLEQLAREAELPRPMLAKVVQRLARAGIVEGRPGPGGGYTMARDPADVSLLEVARVWEDDEFGTRCILGLPGCGERQHCPFHPAWGQIRDELLQVLRDNTLQDMIEGDVPLPS